MTRKGLVPASPDAFDSSPMREDWPCENFAQTLQVSRSHKPLVHNVLRVLRGIFLDAAPIWCYPMRVPRSVEPSETDSNGESPRITVTLRKADYEEVCRLARRMKVSNAWVIRDAVEKYVADEEPLFSRYGSAS